MDDQFLTGYADIDQQHRVLFGIIDHVREPTAHEFADNVQTALDLIKYVIQHFAFEEQLMIKSAYPDAARHLDKHREITATVVVYKERLLHGEDANAELATFIDTWIKHHIGGEDKRLAGYLASLSP